MKKVVALIASFVLLFLSFSALSETKQKLKDAVTPTKNDIIGWWGYFDDGDPDDATPDKNKGAMVYCFNSDGSVYLTSARFGAGKEETAIIVRGQWQIAEDTVIIAVGGMMQNAYLVNGQLFVTQPGNLNAAATLPFVRVQLFDWESLKKIMSEQVVDV